MEFPVICGIAGGVGGLVRGVVGLIKAVKNKKDFELKKLLTTLIEAWVIGTVTGYALQNPWVAFVTAYGGTDFIDSIGLKFK